MTDPTIEQVARTYRAESIGQFDRPTGSVREHLLAQQPAHDVFSSAFTTEGCLTYGPALTRFSVRRLLVVQAASVVDADAEAALEAEVRALALVESCGARRAGDVADVPRGRQAAVRCTGGGLSTGLAEGLPEPLSTPLPTS